MPLRLLAINPNTSPSVTDHFVATARSGAPEGVEVTGVTGRFGARIVSTKAENVIAGHSVLDLIADHAADCDAVIIAISFDTALVAAREVLGIPVIGMTGAALDAAARHGRLGMVTFGSVSVALYERLIGGCGHDVMLEVVETVSAADYLGGHSDARVIAAVARLAAGGARAVVICGAAMVGIAARIAMQAAVPVYDGAAPSVAAALAGIRAGGVAQPGPRPLSGSTGLPSRLAALIAGERRAMA